MFVSQRKTKTKTKKQKTHVRNNYAVQVYSQSQICLSGRMNRALLRSRSFKLRSTPDSAMNSVNLELSQG